MGGGICDMVGKWEESLKCGLFIEVDENDSWLGTLYKEINRRSFIETDL